MLSVNGYKKNIFLTRNLVEKNLTDYINQFLKIEGLLVTLEQTEPDNKTVILVKYGTFEKSYELMLTLHLSVYDDGCSESGATGYTRDLNYPQ